jgi:serine/threonine protein kinase
MNTKDQTPKKETIDDYSIISVVGKGSYAKVFLVKNIHTEKLHAMKVLKKEKIEQRKQETHVKVERDVLINIDHPFVIKFFSSF